MAAYTSFNAMKTASLTKVTLGANEVLIQPNGLFTLGGGKNVTTATNLVLEFDAEVSVGTGNIQFCNSWLSCASPAVSFQASSKALFPPSGSQSSKVVVANLGLTASKY